VTGCFLDTTVLVNLCDSEKPDYPSTEAFVQGHQPAEVPDYAAREVLAGLVHNCCILYNTLRACRTHGEALLAILKMPPVAGRKRELALKELAARVEKIFTADEVGSSEDHKREHLQDIAIRIQTLWDGAKSPRNVTRIQPLHCFNGGELERGSAGEFRGPNDTFDCLAMNKNCAAAAYLCDDATMLSKMITALDAVGGQLGDSEKRETKSRRRILRDLKLKGPGLTKPQCRALGDAYFAAMCPEGSLIATTNLNDFEPLCNALGRQVRKP
jgi:hypothetical protein